MLFATIAFVLAIVVPLLVGAALLTYVQNVLWSVARTQSESFSATQGTLATLSTQLAALGSRIADCESGLKQTTSTHLAAELAGLGAEVDKLARNMRKQFGSVWAELQHDGVLERNKDTQGTLESPEEVRARLRLAHGLPSVGGRSNGAATTE